MHVGGHGFSVSFLGSIVTQRHGDSRMGNIASSGSLRESRNVSLTSAATCYLMDYRQLSGTSVSEGFHPGTGAFSLTATYLLYHNTETPGSIKY